MFMVTLIFLLFVSKSSGVVQTADKCAKKTKKIKITKQSSELSLESIGCEAFPRPVTQVRSSPVAQGKPLGDLLHCSRKATREVTGAWSISRSSAPMRYLGWRSQLWTWGEGAFTVVGKEVMKWKMMAALHLSNAERQEVSAVLAARQCATNPREVKKTLRLEWNSEQVNQQPKR